MVLFEADAGMPRETFRIRTESAEKTLDLFENLLIAEPAFASHPSFPSLAFPNSVFHSAHPFMIMHLTQPQNGRDNRRAVTGTARLILSEFTAKYAVIMAEGTGVEPVRPATGQWILSPLVLADDQPLR